MANVNIIVTIKEKDPITNFERTETSKIGFEGNFEQAREVMKKIGIQAELRNDEITGRQQLEFNEQTAKGKKK